MVLLAPSDGDFHLDGGVMLVADELGHSVIPIEDRCRFSGGDDGRRLMSLGIARELFACTFEMVLVDMHVVEMSHESADRHSEIARDQMLQERVGGDVEGDAEHQVARPLTPEQVQLSTDGGELKARVASG